MARPIWKGQISFGLVNIPVTLYGAESRFDLHFQMLDSRNHARIRYERVNELTGEEVPWGEIVKAFEYDENNYVVLNEQDLEKLKAEANQTVEITDFVATADIDPVYFEKPYYLVPGKKGEKGYVLLREALQQSGKVGIARVVIRSRQYLAALMPMRQALILNLMRWPQELRSLEEYDIPAGTLDDYRISRGELDMALQLIKSMTRKWSREDHHDENRERMLHWIEAQVEQGKISVVKQKEHADEEKPEGRDLAGPNIVDMMDLLKKSLANKGGKATSDDLAEAKEHAATGTEGRVPRARKSTATVHPKKNAPVKKSAPARRK